MAKPKIYAVYKGEEFITTGTLRELAAYFGIKQQTIKFMTTPAYKRRCKDGKNRREVFLLDDDDE